uniref:Reverse transcriptase domain-containing protein n=1 Tax=Tanacetum cinerariifolium TaxID=118510 RepID=A0A6L2KYZ3_TANCI|nr:hypothetical protein [Tanacetum cinerariifolium]
MGDFMGDFNVSLNLEDYFSGPSCLNSAMNDFKAYVNKIEVMDINSTGLHYTWNQKPRSGGGVMKKLDRIMVERERRGVLYVSRGYQDEIFKEADKEAAHSHGNLHDRVNAFRNKLDEAKKAMDCNPLDTNMRKEEAVYASAFNEEKLDEERLLKQKSKIEWLEVGDSNSAFFHKSVKSRNQRSRIKSIRDATDCKVIGPLVTDYFVNHYHQFLGIDMECDDLNIEGLFLNRISTDTSLNMVRNVINKEIKTAVFDIRDDRVPGPDGITFAFFKKSWDIVGNDVCNASHEFFYNDQLLKEINHTFLALIPKVSTPLKVTDYRPTSNRGPPRCAFKVDIQKAYDTVDWKFLATILKCFGFHNKMVKWIMACVTLASLSRCINRDIHGFFKRKQGLRQGDLISPYLFTMVMEVLTLIIKRRVKVSDTFRYHNCYEELQLVNICVADDLFIFTRGDVESARLIMKALEEFKKSSGLVPSIPKSMVYFCNVQNHIKKHILSIMPFVEGTLSVKYLGVPLISSRLLNRDCKVLVEKVSNRTGD